MTALNMFAIRQPLVCALPWALIYNELLTPPLMAPHTHSHHTRRGTMRNICHTLPQINHESIQMHAKACAHVHARMHAVHTSARVSACMHTFTHLPARKYARPRLRCSRRAWGYDSRDSKALARRKEPGCASQQRACMRNIFLWLDHNT